MRNRPSQPQFLLEADEPSLLFNPVTDFLEFVLLPVGILAYFAYERKWFGRLATLGFGLMASTAIIGLVMNAIANYTPFGVAFLGVIITLPFTLIGGVLFGVALLRADIGPRLAAWLLIASPVGLFVTIAYTQVMAGIIAYPWAGALALFGLAWVVLGYRLWTRRIDASVANAAPQ